jgi:hypothetical protein
MLARVRTDVGRQAIRARNGVKYCAGIGRPQVGQTPKDVVWKPDGQSHRVEVDHPPHRGLD